MFPPPACRTWVRAAVKRPECARADTRRRLVERHGQQLARLSSHVEVLSRSCSPRYGARYFAAILLGGDHVGVSVISELNPWPPVIFAVCTWPCHR